MKKVISYSLYGHKDFYLLGMIESIKIINSKFNDWNIYIFYNNIPKKIKIILENQDNVQLIKCNSKNYNWEGMFWRFYPLDYKDVDIFISRDADSRINEREMKLVDEWIKSNKTFHIIRDHPRGHRLKILGGMFGIKVKNFKNKNKDYKNINFYLNLYYKKFSKNKIKGPDQSFLGAIIYPMIKNDNLTHIAYESVRFNKRDILITPCPKDFVGKRINPKYKIKEEIIYLKNQKLIDKKICNIKNLSLQNDILYVFINKDFKFKNDLKGINNIIYVYKNKRLNKNVLGSSTNNNQNKNVPDSSTNSNHNKNVPNSSTNSNKNKVIVPSNNNKNAIIYGYSKKFKYKLKNLDDDLNSDLDKIKIVKNNITDLELRKLLLKILKVLPNIKIKIDKKSDLINKKIHHI